MNGECITPQLFGDCLYLIKLLLGENVIEMRYSIEYLVFGVVCMTAGILLLLAQCIIRHRKVFIG